MKRLSLAVLLVATTAGFAQEKEQQHGEVKGQHEQREKKTPEQRANGLTNKMTEKLGLNETQKTQVYNINLATAQKNDAVRSNTALTKEQKKAQLEANQADRSAQFKTVLTTEQYAKYEAWEKERKAKREANQQDGGKGKGKGKSKKGTTPPPADDDDEL